MNGIRHWWRTARKRMTARRCLRLPPGGRLHVGCGHVHLEGWINIDNRPYPAADYVVDVRDGLPFRGLAFLFAEHFIEHLPYWEAVRFLRDSRAALAPDGVLRLSTPNLEWVVATQFDGGSVGGCFALNKSFRGWGHHFLYTMPALTAALRDAGFARIEAQAWGESAHPELQGLERHERDPDLPGLPHVLVVEASGVGGASDPALATAEADYLAALGAD